MSPDGAARGQPQGPEPLRRLVHALALVPILAGLALLPLFLSGSLPGSWATPTYVALVAATVLVGSLAARGAHPAVPAVGLVVLAAAGLWLWARRPIPVPDLGELAAAWRLTAPAGGLPSWWPMVLAGPAGLVVAWETLRGEPGLPSGDGGGGFEALPARTGLFGLTLVGVGVAGTLFAGSTFLEKVAVVAPIFEELAKMGLALALMSALGLSRGGPAFALGILSGMTFGLLEHAVTYSSEAVTMYVVRVLFHALSAGLSALVYVHLRRREGLAPGAAWFAIGPSAIVHAANNVTAIGMGLAELLFPIPATVGPLFGAAFVSILLVLTLVTAVRPARVCGAIEGVWDRFNGLGKRHAARPRWR